MVYHSGTGCEKGWILRESKFPRDSVGKGETVFCQGNGYLGVRAAMEEYVNECSRHLVVAGTFDFDEGDTTTELPNVPDVTNMVFAIDGEVVSPDNAEHYCRFLNLRNGLLTRRFVWKSKTGKTVNFEFLRVVSLSDRHLICQKVKILPSEDCELTVRSGIDGSVSDCRKHFSFVCIKEKNGILSVTAKTKESEILFSVMTAHRAYIGEKTVFPVKRKILRKNDDRIYEQMTFALSAKRTFTLTKTSNVHTNRDLEKNGCTVEVLENDAWDHLLCKQKDTFEDILSDSAAEWENRIWNCRDVKIETNRISDQLAIRFAIYHLTVMSPVHDNRMNIGAKGLSGPGYHGHTFWDTEVFMLPYFIFTAPSEARSLLEYRYEAMPAAKKNARKNGYSGAMYPWESAWITDGEATPAGWNMGLMEQHITADVAMAIYYYHTVTGDHEFMEKCGYEMLINTALFWMSRFEWNESENRYEITHIIGPDEYKENVDNNAYTNYLAQNNLLLAAEYAEKLKREKAELYDELDKKTGIENALPKMREMTGKIYLPVANQEGLVPQNDTFLTLIDIATEKSTLSTTPKRSHRLIERYGMDRVMVSKQADLMLLMFLFEDFFDAETKRKNFYFYEKRCLHESSLSLSTYSALAADLGEKNTAYVLYRRAAMIDMGSDPHSSDEGIHAASLGGIWQCTVLGFAGIRLYGGQLRIQPHLPDEWTALETRIFWQGKELFLMITKSQITVKNLSDEEVSFLCDGRVYTVREQICFTYEG